MNAKNSSDGSKVTQTMPNLHKGSLGSQHNSSFSNVSNINLSNNSNGNSNSNANNKSVSSDTKALLKAKLLSGSLSHRTRLIGGNSLHISDESNSVPVKMTASLKYKEREEKRRKKKEKALERKKKLMEKEGKKGEATQPPRKETQLTDDDLSMLRRWSRMIPPKADSVKDGSETSSDTSSVYGVAPASVSSTSSSSDYNVRSVSSDYTSGVDSISSVATDCSVPSVRSDQNVGHVDPEYGTYDAATVALSGVGSNFYDYRDHIENSNSPPESYAAVAPASAAHQAPCSPSQNENVDSDDGGDHTATSDHMATTGYRGISSEEGRILSRGDPLISSVIAGDPRSSLSRPPALTIGAEDDVADSVESLSRLLSRSAKLESDGVEAEKRVAPFPSLTTPELVGAVGGGGGAYGVDIDLSPFAVGAGLNSFDGFLSGETLSSSDVLSTPKLIDGWLDLRQELEEKRQKESHNDVPGDVSLLEHELNQLSRGKK